MVENTTQVAVPVAPPVDKFNRQVNLFNPRNFEDREVTIVGLGNIGSHTALTLCRMGIKKFSLFDFDTIEEHNLASQSYTATDIGRTKVRAIQRQLIEIEPRIEISISEHKFVNYGNLDIIVLGVDSLDARREIAALLKQNPPKLIIDGRIGGEQLELYTFEKVEDFEASIPTGPAAEEGCGERYIAYVSVIIAGLIACQVKKYLTGQQLTKSFIINVPTLTVLKDVEW